MATHKYSTGHDYGWHYRNGRPRLTAHVCDRWDERMPNSARSPEWAYLLGTRDTDIVTHPHFVEFRGDDRRYLDAVTCYAGFSPGGTRYTAVLLERQHRLITAYRAQSIRDPAVRQYVEARAAENGVVLE